MTTGAPWSVGGMHHVGLTVTDMERSLAFYRDLLGFEVIGRRPRIDADYVGLQTGYPRVVLEAASLRLPGGGPSLELARYLTHAGPPAEPATNRAGTSHLCLLVTDLRACHAALSALGIRFRSAPVEITAGPNRGGLVIYLFDPDGYVVELFQPPA